LRAIGQYCKLDFTDRSKNILIFMCNTILMEDGIAELVVKRRFWRHWK